MDIVKRDLVLWGGKLVIVPIEVRVQALDVALRVAPGRQADTFEPLLEVRLFRRREGDAGARLGCSRRGRGFDFVMRRLGFHMFRYLRRE